MIYSKGFHHWTSATKYCENVGGGAERLAKKEKEEKALGSLMNNTFIGQRKLSSFMKCSEFILHAKWGPLTDLGVIFCSLLVTLSLKLMIRAPFVYLSQSYNCHIPSPEHEQRTGRTGPAAETQTCVGNSWEGSLCPRVGCAFGIQCGSVEPNEGIWYSCGCHMYFQRRCALI